MSTFKEEDGLRAHGLVQEKYAARLREVQEKIEHLQKSRRVFLSVAAFATFIAIVAFAAGYTSFAVVMGVAGLLSFAQRMRAGQRWGSLERECEYFERGLARMSSQWQEFEERGETFTRKDHLYQRDLHVLGEGSLFQLLCTTRTRAGAERLAVYLLDPVEHAESVRRQEAIQELRDAPELREKIAGLGKYRSQECAPDAFEAWFSMPVLQLHPVLRVLMFLCSSAAFLIGMSVQSKILPWAVSWPWIACLLALPLCIAGWFLQQVRERAEALRPLTSAVTLLSEAFSLLETQRFNAPKLQELVQRLKAAGASASLRKLTRILGTFEQRDKPYFSFTMLLAAGTQIVLLAESWRRRYQHAFVEGISGWAEFEALEAIAGFAYEHPEWAFPELCEGGASFEAVGLGHPLLPAHHCVRNDVRLDEEDRYFLISGSNMQVKVHCCAQWG
jgi:hypothetical protein